MSSSLFNSLLSRRQFSFAAALMTTTGAWAAPTASVEVSSSLHADGKPELKSDTSKVILAVSAKSSFYYLPLTIAEQLGHFQREGIELEIIEYQSALRAQQALASGAVDVVCGSFDHVINLHSKNQLVQSFVAMGRTPQMAMGVSVKTMPSYKTVTDLKGKKIGISAPGTASNMMASLLLQRAGLRTNDVSFIGVGTAAGAVAALRAGQIDAICNLEPIMTQLEQKGEIKIISDARTLKGTQALYGGLMPAACLYAAPEFQNKNPDTTQALSNAIVHTLKWLQVAGPRDLIGIVPEAYLLGDRGLYLACYNNLRESISLDGMISMADAKTTLRAMVNFEATLRQDKIELSKTFTNVHAKRANTLYAA